MLKSKINEYNKLLKEHYSHLFKTVNRDAKASEQANDLVMFGAAKQATLETVLEKYNISMSDILTDNKEVEIAKQIQKVMYLSESIKRKLH